jgi:hypothetical protein
MQTIDHSFTLPPARCIKTKRLPKAPIRKKSICSAVEEQRDLLRVVSNAIRERYGTVHSKRVVESLEFLAAEKEYYLDHPTFGIQRASSFIAGLEARPFHFKSSPDYLWMENLEREYIVILQELQAAISNPELERLGNYVWAPAAREEAIAYGPDWRTLVLQDRCIWENSNSCLFPKTVELIKKYEVPSVEVFFARQSPQTGIKAHSDNTNFILTSHLGLDVPEGECWMNVGMEKHFWKNGCGVIADTSFIHSTENRSEKKDRYVLIIRFWHPGLSEIERNALTFLFDAIDDPSRQGIVRANTLADKREENFSSHILNKKRENQLERKKGLGKLKKGMN